MVNKSITPAAKGVNPLQVLCPAIDALTNCTLCHFKSEGECYFSFPPKPISYYADEQLIITHLNNRINLLEKDEAYNDNKY